MQKIVILTWLYSVFDSTWLFLGGGLLCLSVSSVVWSVPASSGKMNSTARRDRRKRAKPQQTPPQTEAELNRRLTWSYRAEVEAATVWRPIEAWDPEEHREEAKVTPTKTKDRYHHHHQTACPHRKQVLGQEGPVEEASLNGLRRIKMTTLGVCSSSTGWLLDMCYCNVLAPPRSPTELVRWCPEHLLLQDAVLRLTGTFSFLHVG